MNEQVAKLDKASPGLPRTTDVAIVGGGPAGLTMAMLLAQFGVDVQLFERRVATTRLPRAHLINQRTMEIFDSLGVAADVYALSPPEDQWHRVGWYTSLAGDLPARGKEIGHVQAWGGGSDAERYARASPQRYANLPQMRLDPLLRAHAVRACPGRIHFGYEVTDLFDRGDGVDLTVRGTDTESTQTIDAKFVLAADGGRLCASLLGIDLVGPSQLYDMVTLHFSADLSAWITDDQTLLYQFINPRGQGSFAGSLCAMGPTQWGPRSVEWSYHQAFAWGDPTARDETVLLQRMRDTLGLPDLDVELHAISRWEFEGVVAERFRSGRVFLAGNAAHRHPPSGGLGLNSAVQDVYNLAWKLALVLRGGARDELLDTYDTERRSVSEYNVGHALHNVGGHRRIAAALGLHQGQDLDDGWREIEVWLSETASGAHRRHQVAAAIESNSDDYGQLNVELGYAYGSGAIVPEPDGTDSDEPFPIQEYTPSTRPGHHLPHARLVGEHGDISTLDAFGPTNFALFVCPEGQALWTAALKEVEAEMTLDTELVVIGPDALRDVDGAWASVRGIGNTGALLIRPDRHVAWRVAEAPADPVGALLQTMRVVL